MGATTLYLTPVVTDLLTICLSTKLLHVPLARSLYSELGFGFV